MLFGPVASKVSAFLNSYAKEKGIYLKINFVNPEHVHGLIDLPTGKSIEECVKLFKGASSHRINEQKLLLGRFAWARGYGAFSVSHSDVDRVCKYIAGQEEHHRLKTFDEEYKRFVEVYGLMWRDEETVKTVSSAGTSRATPALKRGVNERFTT
jgi:putative transposase